MNSNSFQIVRLDNEEKVIALGTDAHELKGVLICETSVDEENGRKSFVTCPIVDDDWSVLSADEIEGGLSQYILGSKGDKIPLRKIADSGDK